MCVWVSVEPADLVGEGPTINFPWPEGCCNVETLTVLP